MKVSELIKVLQGMPQDADVVTPDGWLDATDGCRDITVVGPRPAMVRPSYVDVSGDQHYVWYDMWAIEEKEFLPNSQIVSIG